jgi:bis(5'-nucleosyl)-tetraphosphatase (symmetrical)
MLSDLTTIHGNTVASDQVPVPIPSPSRSLDAIDHLELPPLGTDEKLFIIGDVHGCLLELKDLVAEAEKLVCLSGLNEDSSRAQSSSSSALRVILVGDLVNKGPFSAGVVQYVRERGWLCVMGNHDYSVVQSFLSRSESGSESESGRKKAWVRELTWDDKQWLSDLPFTISVPPVACVVHAGLLPGVSLRSQSPADMINMRNVSAAKALAEDAVGSYEESTAGTATPTCAAADGVRWQAHKDAAVGQPWAQVWAQEWESHADGDGERGGSASARGVGVVPHVYFGHDAVRGLQQTAFATGLDTGCCYGRCLSGMLLPDRRLIQVPARAVYEVAGAAKAKLK